MDVFPALADIVPEALENVMCNAPPILNAQGLPMGAFTALKDIALIKSPLQNVTWNALQILNVLVQRMDVPFAQVDVAQQTD
jgi:hypothetical protein